MKTFKKFMKEMRGDFGSPSPKPIEKCYGKKISYAGLKKKVCAFHRKRE
jgi:hypothetical protein